MKILKTLISENDKSVNFIFDNWLEARFVRREAKYFIVYLSSHDGCNKACRFCHLTQTGQTSFKETTIEEYIEQAKVVLNYYKEIKYTQGLAEKVNFNFMARGEPLANSVILNNAKELFDELEKLAKEQNLNVKFNISSIIPEEIKNYSIEDIFKNVTQDYGIYYSLYSVDEKFRKRWLPKALSYNIALEKISQWQKNAPSNAFLALHWAFIKDENDSEKNLLDIKDILEKYNIKAKFNLVRYNPYSKQQGEESDDIVLQQNFDLINTFLKKPGSRIVPRVGFDVKASCGMFINKQDY